MSEAKQDTKETAKKTTYYFILFGCYQRRYGEEKQYTEFINVDTVTPYDRSLIPRKHAMAILYRLVTALGDDVVLGTFSLTGIQPVTAKERAIWLEDTKDDVPIDEMCDFQHVTIKL